MAKGPTKAGQQPMKTMKALKAVKAMKVMKAMPMKAIMKAMKATKAMKAMPMKAMKAMKATKATKPTPMPKDETPKPKPWIDLPDHITWRLVLPCCQKNCGSWIFYRHYLQETWPNCTICGMAWSKSAVAGPKWYNQHYKYQ